ncbi:MAG: phosphoribosyl-AMP cyclohydrolase [Geodermatophilaceae bacterium]|nr:phosphoribosyl-AMP cyclohydrolase [Geodermatophilaceae bacterium]
MTNTLDPRIAGLLRTDDRGLLPVVVQSVESGEVLMLAWMDAEALARTLRSGRATYWSRSRSEYWVKGATSGNTQQVRQVLLDCDGDTILLRVEQTGPACHTGAPTCFGTDLTIESRATGSSGPR